LKGGAQRTQLHSTQQQKSVAMNPGGSQTQTGQGRRQRVRLKLCIKNGTTRLLVFKLSQLYKLNDIREQRMVLSFLGNICIIN
jgi:hypothetical protein